MFKSLLLTGGLVVALTSASFAQTQKKTVTGKQTTVHTSVKTKQNAPQPKPKIKHTEVQTQSVTKKPAEIPVPKDPAKRTRNTPVAAPVEKPLPNIEIE